VASEPKPCCGCGEPTTSDIQWCEECEQEVVNGPEFVDVLETQLSATLGPKFDDALREAKEQQPDCEASET
jgi:hypothetical protein